jgi:predicted transcriptional regulator
MILVVQKERIMPCCSNFDNKIIDFHGENAKLVKIIKPHDQDRKVILRTVWEFWLWLKNCNIFKLFFNYVNLLEFVFIFHKL